MKLIDISWPITENISAYDDKHTVKFDPLLTWKNDKLRKTKLVLDTHTGTHVDAESHFVEDGNTIDVMDLHRVSGKCQVLDLTGVREKIRQQDLELFTIQENDIVLLKTSNSLLDPTAKFNPDFIYLDASAASYLVKKKVKAVGIDYLGIEHSQKGHPTHITLMKQHIPIVEGLRLAHVKPGKYAFICLPLLLVGLEGAPARAVLMTI